MSAYVPAMQIVQEIYVRGAGTTSNSAQYPLQGPCACGERGQRESRNLLASGPAVANPLQGGISLDIGCLKKLHAMFHLYYCRHPRRRIARMNCMKMLLPECFCCGRVLHMCVHVWNHTVLYLCIWKGSKLFLLCSEFLGCFSDKITLNEAVFLWRSCTWRGKTSRLSQNFSPCWQAVNLGCELFMWWRPAWKYDAFTGRLSQLLSSLTQLGGRPSFKSTWILVWSLFSRYWFLG